MSALSEELQKPEYAQLVAERNYQAIADILNERPLIPNPVPQGNIPKPLNMVDLLQAVSAAELELITNTPNLLPLDSLREVVDNNDRQRLALTLGLLQKTHPNEFSQNSASNIMAIINAQILDPSYQAQIPGEAIAEELGIYPVSAIDVQTALNPQTPPVIQTYVAPQDPEPPLEE